MIVYNWVIMVSLLFVFIHVYNNRMDMIWLILILPPVLILFDTSRIVASDSIIDFYIQIYCSTYFHINVSKHK
jgi:hypothetical protein